MYIYDVSDHTVAHQRVDEFGEQVKRRLVGELSQKQFGPLRLVTFRRADDEKAAIDQFTGPGFSAEGIVDAVKEINAAYLDPGETFIVVYPRIGAAPFKERLYAGR